MSMEQDMEKTPAAGVHAVRAWAGRCGSDKRWGTDREDTVKIRAYASDAEKLKAIAPTMADAVRVAVEAMEARGGGNGQ